MTTDPIHVERRGAQRFDFHLAVSVRRPGSDVEGHGFTQDISGRGTLFYTDFDVSAGEAVDITLVMPSEITLTQSMRVRCRGKVVRVIPPAAGNRRGVAVHLEGYEFLPDSESESSTDRISALHEHRHSTASSSRARVSTLT